MNYHNYLVADSRNLVQVYQQQGLEKADLVLTSPPYYDTKSYGKNNDQIGCNQLYRDYIADTVNVLQQSYAVTTDNATLWLVMDTVRRDKKLYPLPFDINAKLEEEALSNQSRGGGWRLRDIIIWNRPKNLPWHARGRLKHEFEYILFFSKNDNYKYHIDRIRKIYEYKDWWLTYPERYNPKGKPPSNIWQFSIPIRGWGNSHQRHLCPFPFPLIERVLTIASDPGDLILDPFAGSGSVLGLAFYMKRNAIGFDISQEYKDEFEKDVLIGAKQYWDNRVRQLERMSRRKEAFEETNIKLRKIKAGLQLHKYFKDRFGVDGAAFFLFDSAYARTCARLVISIPVNRGIDRSALADVLDTLNGRYGLHITLRLTSRNVNRHGLELYGYSGRKNYSFDHRLSLTRSSDTSDHDLDSDSVYSDIELHIEDPTQYLDMNGATPVGNERSEASSVGP